MSKFGETIRQLRIAQDLGLRETAGKIGISPTYLSRIERGKESPPKPEVIKALAKVLVADPDVLFRLCPSTDPDIVALLKERPKLMDLIRLVMHANLSDEQLERVQIFIERDIIADPHVANIEKAFSISSP
jgi:HTH-type transcriptional regulator, competence development regulator